MENSHSILIKFIIMLYLNEYNLPCLDMLLIRITVESCNVIQGCRVSRNYCKFIGGFGSIPNFYLLYPRCNHWRKIGRMQNNINQALNIRYSKRLQKFVNASLAFNWPYNSDICNGNMDPKRINYKEIGSFRDVGI